MSIQKQIMNDLHVKPSIDPKQEIEDRVNFLKQYLKKQVPKALCSASAGAGFHACGTPRPVGG